MFKRVVFLFQSIDRNRGKHFMQIDNILVDELLILNHQLLCRQTQ